MTLTAGKMFNCVFLIWGCLFCLVAALAFWGAKNYDAQKRRWMMVMQQTAAVMMLSDAGSLVFDGMSGLAGWWMVRIANLALFLFTDITMLAFTRYLCVCLFTPEETRSLKRVQAARIAGWAGVGLVILTQFTGLYYTIDAANVYHRSGGYWISLAIPMLCMLMDSSLLLQFRQRISQRQLTAIGSYILLPLVGSVIQAMHYGLSLISLTVGISMVLMFLVSMNEQNNELRQLESSRAQIEEKLEIATMLNRCVEKLSDGTDIERALQNLMEVVRDYFCADRSYLFELTRHDKILVNSYESVAEGVEPQIDKLQEVPAEIVDHWMECFRQERVYYMDNLEQEKGHGSYESLEAQKVWRLLAVPICRDGKIIGLLGVDNPREHAKDMTLLASIQFFITNSLQRRDQKKYLEQLSYYDALTHLRNRNGYIEGLNKWKHTSMEQVGVIFIDLNGLKETNDAQGHEAGDRLLCRLAEVLDDVFPGEAYRIGGDEFVVLLQNIPQAEFEASVQQLRTGLRKKDVSAAVGCVWEQYPDDLEAMLRQADDYMYREKDAMKRL